MDTLKRFFAPPIFDNKEKTRAAELLNTLLVSLIHLLSIGLAGMVIIGGMSTLQIGLLLAVIMIMFGLRIPLHRGFVNAVSWVFIITLTVIITIVMAIGGTVRLPSISIFILISVIAGLTLGQKSAYLSAFVNIVIVSVLIWAEVNGHLPPISKQSGVQQMLMFSVTAIMTVLLINQALSRIQISLDLAAEKQNQLAHMNLKLEQRVADATRNLELSAEVAQNVALLQEPAAMLIKAADLIQERFGLYYTQIYLTDTAGHNLILSAGTGEVGQSLIRQGHRMGIDLGSINGIAALERRTVIVENTAESSLYRTDPLLPETRSEMAIPMIAGERVMGVLDLQSSQAGALSAENLTAFEALAGQLAITIVNINLFSEVERSRQEVEAQTLRQTQEDWREFLDGIQRKEHLGYCYENDAFTPLIEPITPEGDPESLVMPIQVLGASIGTLQFGGERPWTEDDYQTVNAVSHQVAQQVENLRLLARAKQYQNEAQEALRRQTREGWDGYQDQVAKESGFVYQDYEVKPLAENGNGFEETIKYEIKVRDEPIGELGIAGSVALSEDDSDLVDYVKEQLSAHLENLRLATQTEMALSETEERVQQLAALNKIGRGLNSAANEDEILAAIKEPAQQAGCESATLFYIEDYESGSPSLMTQVANWRPDGGSLVPAGYQYDLREFRSTNLLFASPDSVQTIEDIYNDKRVDIVLKGLWTQMGFEAITIIPIIQAGKWLGLVTFGWSETHRFSPQEVEIYQAIISLITPTVQSRRLFEQAQAALAETESMLEITSIASSSLELDTTFTQVLNKVLEITNAGSGLISVYNPQTETLELVSHDLPEPLLKKLQTDGLQGTLCDMVYQGKETIILEDIRSEAPMDLTGLIKMGFQAYQGVPLASKGSVTGTLCIFYNQAINAQNSDTTILEVVGQQIGVAIENAYLFEQTQSALNDAETFRQLAEASGQGVGMATMDGISTYVNPRMVEMLGLKEPNDILGKPFIPLYPEEYQQKLDAEIMPHLQETGNWTGELALTRTDGSIFPTQENFFLLMDDDDNPQFLVDIVTDITDRHAQEAATAKRAAELATVAEVGTIISTVLEEQTLLETVVKLTRERFDLYHCHIFLADDDFQTLQVKACGWKSDSPHAGTIEQVLINTDQEKSLVALAARNQQAIIVNDVQGESGWLPNEQLPETRSEMAVPMVAGNQILGVLDIQADKVGRFTEEDISIMTTLSSQVAVALQNARTHTHTQQQADQEATINLISQRIQSTTSVENALQVAIRELGRALGAKRTNVQLGLPSQQEKK